MTLFLMIIKVCFSWANITVLPFIEKKTVMRYEDKINNNESSEKEALISNHAHRMWSKR